MTAKLGAIFSIIFGVLFIIFNKPMSRYAVNAWRKRIKIATPAEIIYKIFFLLGGIIFVVLGILTLLEHI